VTLPFKVEAFEYATRHSPRARAAGAVNTLAFDGAAAFGDNTDGVGLVRDLTGRLAFGLQGARVLLLGAGGAARGVLLPLLEAGVACLVIANRTPEKAAGLAALAGDDRVSGGGFETPGEGFDVVVNATSAGLGGAAPAIGPAAWRGVRLAYDMVYGSAPTAFMQAAAAQGCAIVSDGLGMLVEQAAESFFVWRRVRPDTAPVYRRLREDLGR
jgi:shikimate dehydrogenase